MKIRPIIMALLLLSFFVPAVGAIYVEGMIIPDNSQQQILVGESTGGGLVAPNNVVEYSIPQGFKSPAELAALSTQKAALASMSSNNLQPSFHSTSPAIYEGRQLGGGIAMPEFNSQGASMPGVLPGTFNPVNTPINNAANVFEVPPGATVLANGDIQIGDTIGHICPPTPPGYWTQANMSNAIPL